MDTRLHLSERIIVSAIKKGIPVQHTYYPASPDLFKHNMPS